LIKRKAVRTVYKDAREVSDEDLYRRFAKGEERAFRLLLDRHGDKVLGYLTKFFGDRELATDLTQDVFIRVISAARRFRGDSSFTTFLFRIVRNLCIDHMRSRSASPDSRAASLDQVDGPGDRPLSDTIAGKEPDGAHRTLAGELSDAVERGLADLPEKQREVFLMREVQGLKFAEIADLLGVNENTVKSRMHYAMVSLRETLSIFKDGT